MKNFWEKSKSLTEIPIEQWEISGDELANMSEYNPQIEQLLLSISLESEKIIQEWSLFKIIN